MNTQHREETNQDDGSDVHQLSRRTLLAAGSVILTGSLAGCAGVDGAVDRVASEAIGTKSASPASLYIGSPELSAGESEVLYRPTGVRVRNVPPTVTASGQEIDLEGWATTTRIDAQNHNSSRSNGMEWGTRSGAQNHNSSRSNRSSGVWHSEAVDTDGDDQEQERVRALVLAQVLDMKEAMSVYAEACRGAAGEADVDALERFAGGFDDVAAQGQQELERCSDDRCRALAERTNEQSSMLSRAREMARSGEWSRCESVCTELRASCDSDADGIADDMDSDGDGLLDGSADLYEYLGGEATIGEDFVVCVPDAQVRNGGPSVAAELTPRRVVEYFLGEKDAEGCSTNDRAVAIHRDLSCRNVLSARLEEPYDKGRGVVGFVNEGGGSVVVTGGPTGPALRLPSGATAAEGMIKVERMEGSVSVSPVESMRDWGTEIQSAAAKVSPTFVCPVAATPADCPCPMPGLFYVCRVRHDEQLLFVGGWRMDEGALYRDSATLLISEGPAEVGAVSLAAVEGEYQDGDDLILRKRPGRTKYGNITLSKRDYDTDTDSFPDGMGAACGDGEPYCWDVQSFTARARKTVGTGCPAEGHRCVVSALDAPVLHLSGAAELSNEVKFKAGAELSKAVN